MADDAAHFDEHQKDFDFSKPDVLIVKDGYSDHPDARVLLKNDSILEEFVKKSNRTKPRVYIPGCGTAYEAIELAKMGCEVWGVDISQKQAEIATLRAKVNGVEDLCHFSCGDALNTEFDDGFFDIVYAHAVIHHFDLGVASSEFVRILNNGGLAVFSEPFGENPLLSFVRNYVPYPGKHRTEDEHPLSNKDIKDFMRPFSTKYQIEYQLFSMLERFFGKGGYVSALERLDNILLKVLPFTKRFCRMVIIVGYK